MKAEERLYQYRCMMEEEMDVSDKKEQEELCLKRAMKLFFYQEEKKRLSYFEFLWQQSFFIQKKWWLFQGITLFMVEVLLKALGSVTELKKGFGIAASLFIVFMIPELWKNKSSNSMEIEESCYYDLRQIYSARLFLFLLTDTAIVTFFCTGSMAVWQIALKDMIILFLLPMAVTGCICFGLLCSRHMIHEGIAVISCFLWSGIWSVLVMNPVVYGWICETMWLVMLMLSVLYMGYCVHKMLCSRAYTFGSQV